MTLVCGGEGHQIHAEAIVVTDHSPPCHYIPGDGATLGPAPPHAEELGGLIPQFYAGLRCGVGRGPTRDSGLGNLGTAAGCG